MVVFFCAIVVTTQILEPFLTRYCTVYRDHLTFPQRRRFISHAWGTAVAVAVADLTLQLSTYTPALFTGAIVSPHHARTLTELSCTITVYCMFELAYTIPTVELLIHHLAVRRRVWAGKFVLFAAWWSIITKLGVYILSLVRYVEMASLGPGVGLAPVNAKPVTHMHSVRWFWTLVAPVPMMCVGFGVSHVNTWVVISS